MATKTDTSSKATKRASYAESAALPATIDESESAALTMRAEKEYSSWESVT